MLKNIPLINFIFIKSEKSFQSLVVDLLILEIKCLKIYLLLIP